MDREILKHLVIYKESHNLFKTVASMRGMTMREYLANLAKKEFKKANKGKGKKDG